MKTRAKVTGVRGSARKARLVADQIRGRGVEDALAILQLSPKRAAGPMHKLIKPGVGNGEQKNEREKAGIDVDNLVVRTVLVDEGPSQWRISPPGPGGPHGVRRRAPPTP